MELEFDESVAVPSNNWFPAAPTGAAGHRSCSPTCALPP